MPAFASGVAGHAGEGGCAKPTTGCTRPPSRLPGCCVSPSPPSGARGGGLVRAWTPSGVVRGGLACRVPSLLLSWGGVPRGVARRCGTVLRTSTTSTWPRLVGGTPCWHRGVYLLVVVVILLNFTADAPASADAALGEGSPGEFGVEPLVEGSAIHRGVPPPVGAKVYDVPGCGRSVRRRRWRHRAVGSAGGGGQWNPPASPPGVDRVLHPRTGRGPASGGVQNPRCAPPSGAYEFECGVPGQ